MGEGAEAAGAGEPETTTARHAPPAEGGPEGAEAEPARGRRLPGAEVDDPEGSDGGLDEKGEEEGDGPEPPSTYIGLRPALAKPYLAPCFHVDNPVRKVAVAVTGSKWFDRIVMAVIGVNCIFLCLYRPTEPDDSDWNSMLERADYFFTVAFTLEMVLKMLTWGLRRYFSDSWNILDFVVVLGGILSMANAASNLSAVRTIRVLRPLRSINAFPGLRDQVSTIFNSLPMVCNVVILCIYLFLLFGILGVQLFGGVLKHRCVPWDSDTDQELFLPSNYAEEAAAAALDASARGVTTDGDRDVFIEPIREIVRMCYMTKVDSWPGYSCPTGTIDQEYSGNFEGSGAYWASRDINVTWHCVKTDSNPNDGVTSFDNLLDAIITIFQCITLEAWTLIMYWAMEATNGWAFIYFVLLVFMGAFFLLNLALAVVATEHDETVKKSQEAAAERKEKETADKEAAALQSANSTASGPTAAAATLDDSAGQLDEDVSGMKALQTIVRRIVERYEFDVLITSLIFANTLTLSMEYDGMSDTYRSVLEYLNLTFTFAFLVEMLLKIAGLGVREYVADRFNCFDVVVNAFSIVELGMASGSGGGGSFSALRAFRILRVLKAAGNLPSLKRFLSTLVNVMSSLVDFLFIVILAIFVFALVGMQLFGGKFEEADGSIPRSNFDTLLWALVTVFQILTGEDWNAVMYSGARAVGKVGVLYFIILMIVGNYLVLNLFVAILLGSFQSAQEAQEQEARKKRNEERQKRAEARARMKNNSVKSFSLNPDAKGDINVSQSSRMIGSIALELNRPAGLAIGDPAEAASTNLPQAQDSDDMPKQMEVDTKRKGNPPQDLKEYTGMSWFLLSNENPVRVHSYNLVNAKWFDRIVLVLIIFSSILMAAESPAANDNEDFADALFYVDVVFTVLFGMEMVLKMTAFSVWGEDGAYLTDNWNRLDCTIVLLAVVNLCASGSGLDWVRSLRALRVLRPLRMINRVPELKVVVNALFASLPGLGNVLMVSLLFWLIFGILGMSLFMGKFKRCVGADGQDFASDEFEGLTKSQCTGGFCMVVNDTIDGLSYTELYDSGETCNGTRLLDSTYVKLAWVDDSEWDNANANFDNIANAMVTLLEMSTTEGWLDVLYNGVDATSVDENPKLNNQEFMVVYFVAFMLVGSLFLVNLFIGIIMDNFYQKRKELGRSALLTSEQAEWVELRQKFLSIKPTKAKNIPTGWRGALVRVVQSRAFEFFILAVIILNVIFMATAHDGMSDKWEDTIDIANRVFTLVFCVEVILKLVAMGYKMYFAESWNCFDFIIVVISVVGEVTAISIGASVLRVLRIARVLRLVKSLKSLSVLFDTLFSSLPTLCNVGILMFLVFFIYAVLGVSLFGEVNRNQEFMTDHANFSNFGYALITLFRMATGESWNGIMYDAMVTSPNCDDDDNANHDNGCGSKIAYVYFLSFVVIGTFVMLNLFLAVVLENYETEREKQPNKVTSENISEFTVVWQEFDRNGSGFIHASYLEPMLRLVKAPLGVRDEGVKRARILRELRVDLVHAKYIYFQDLVQELLCRAYGVTYENLPPQAKKGLTKAMVDMRSKNIVKLWGDNAGDSSSRRSCARSPSVSGDQLSPGSPASDGGEGPLTSSEFVAARTIQAAVHKFLFRKRMRDFAELQQLKQDIEESRRLGLMLLGLLPGGEEQGGGGGGGGDGA